MTELRQCDCGAAGSMGMDITEALDRPGWCEATVLCYSCYRQGPMCIAETEDAATAAAITGWNHRPAEDALRVRNKSLEDVLRSMLAQFDVYVSPFSDQFVNKSATPDGRDVYVLKTVQWQLREVIVRAHKLLGAEMEE